MRWDLDLNPIAHFPRGTILNGFRCALAIFSGKLFLIRDSETPAGVSESPFHGWGVKSSSICSTAFCESAVLRGYPFRHRLRRCHLPQGGGLWHGGKVSGYVPLLKKQLWKIRRFSRVANIKIFFPLFMRKANAERIPNRFCSPTITHKAPEGVSPGGFAML